MPVGRIAPAVVREVATRIFSASYTLGLYYIDDIGNTWSVALLVREPTLHEYYDYYTFDPVDEVSYTGYARQSFGRNLTAMLGTHHGSGASSGTSGTVTNASSLYFPLCTTSSAVVTHVALVGQYSRTIVYWELDPPMQLSNTTPGFYPCLPARSLAIRLDN